MTLGLTDTEGRLVVERTCSVENCERKAKCRGYCDTHYKRWLQGRPIDAPLWPTPRTELECTIEACEQKQFATSFCRSHYHRNRKYGDPLAGPPIAVKYSSVEERFWSRVDKTGDCWTWTGPVFNGGYATFTIKKKSYYVHRLSYEWANGPIPDGQLVDHRCHNPACVNPNHLRLADKSQNNQHRLGAQVNSRSGVRGVQLLPSGRWQARVRHKRQDIHVGIFGTCEQADAAARAKRNELFTHNDIDRSA